MSHNNNNNIDAYNYKAPNVNIGNSSLVRMVICPKSIGIGLGLGFELGFLG